jgi:hypothetical protein
MEIPLRITNHRTKPNLQKLLFGLFRQVHSTSYVRRDGQPARSRLYRDNASKGIAEREKWNSLFDALKLSHSNSRGNFVFFETGRSGQSPRPLTLQPSTSAVPSLPSISGPAS